jgi:peroxiredoxin
MIFRGLAMNKSLKVMMISMLALGLLITGCSAGAKSGARVGAQAPDFKLPNLDGQSVSLRDFRGSPLLINFWASRCPPCVDEMPHLQKIFEEWSSKGLVVLAINAGESQTAVKAFMQSNNLSLPVLLDTRQDVAQKYELIFLPTTFFIDKDGIIQVKIIGAFPNKAAVESNLSQIIP